MDIQFGYNTKESDPEPLGILVFGSNWLGD